MLTHRIVAGLFASAMVAVLSQEARADEPPPTRIESPLLVSGGSAFLIVGTHATAVACPLLLPACAYASLIVAGIPMIVVGAQRVPDDSTHVRNVHMMNAGAAFTAISLAAVPAGIVGLAFSEPHGGGAIAWGSSWGALAGGVAFAGAGIPMWIVGAQRLDGPEEGGRSQAPPFALGPGYMSWTESF